MWHYHLKDLDILAIDHYGMVLQYQQCLGGGWLLAWEIAMDVWPVTQAPSMVNDENSSHHRCKICGKPTYCGQNWAILKENGNFLPQVEIKFPKRNP